MLSRTAARPRRQNSHRADEVKRCEPYKKWIRGRDCTLAGKSGHICRGFVRACHVDFAGDKGMGTKVSDMHVIPMCDGAHGEQHSLGWKTFAAKWSFDPLALAGELWRYWQDSTAMGAQWKARRQ